MMRSMLGPRTRPRAASEMPAAWKACPRRCAVKLTPAWKISYGHPSAPGAEPPALRTARAISTKEGGGKIREEARREAASITGEQGGSGGAGRRDGLPERCPMLPQLIEYISRGGGNAPTGLKDTGDRVLGLKDPAPVAVDRGDEGAVHLGPSDGLRELLSSLVPAGRVKATEPILRVLLVDEVEAGMVLVDRGDPLGELVGDGREPRPLSRSGELRGERAGDLRGAGPPVPPVREHPLEGVVAVGHEPRVEGRRRGIRVIGTREGGGRDFRIHEQMARRARVEAGEAR